MIWDMQFQAWYDSYVMTWCSSLKWKSLKWLINLVCSCLVNCEYMWPLTSRNIGLLALILCQLLVFQVNPSSVIMQVHTALKYRPSLCHIMSRLLNAMTYHSSTSKKQGIHQRNIQSYLGGNYYTCLIASFIFSTAGNGLEWGYMLNIPAIWVRTPYRV